MGKPVEITIVRDGKPNKLQVTIEEQPQKFGVQRVPLPQAPRRDRDTVNIDKIGVEATEDGTNEFGTFYRIEGNLVGPNGQELPVVTIWLRWHSDRSFHFVTLKPWRKRS